MGTVRGGVRRREWHEAKVVVTGRANTIPTKDIACCITYLVV